MSAEYPSETLQKTLAVFIAENGGLANVVLERLCDAHPKIFGGPGSDRRRGIQYKVRDWKDKPQTFDAVLQRARASSLLLPAVEYPNTTEGVPTGLSTPLFVPEAMLGSRMSTRSQSRSPIRSPPMGSPPMRSLSLSPMRSPGLDGEAPPAPTVSFSPPAPSVSFDEIWQFDGVNPLIKHSVIIAPFWDHAHVDGCLHNGFGIEVVTPYKDDVKSDMYTVTHHPEENAVMLSMPRVSFMHRFCRESLATMAQFNARRLGDNYTYIQNYELHKMAALNALDKDKDLQLTKILIKPPPSLRIVNSTFSTSDAEGATVKVNPDMCAVVKDSYVEEDESTHADTSEGSMMLCLKWFIGFKEMGARDVQTSQPSQKTAGEAALDAALGGVAHMSLGRGDSSAMEEDLDDEEDPDVERRREQEERRQQDERRQQNARRQLDEFHLQEARRLHKRREESRLQTERRLQEEERVKAEEHSKEEEHRGKLGQLASQQLKTLNSSAALQGSKKNALVEVQRALLRDAVSVAKSTRAAIAAERKAAMERFTCDPAPTSSMDVEPILSSDDPPTPRKPRALKSSIKSKSKLPRKKTVTTFGPKIVSSPKKASIPSQSKTYRLKDPPLPLPGKSPAMEPITSTPAPTTILPVAEEAVPARTADSLNTATQQDIDAFWKEMHGSSATPPPVSHASYAHSASPFASAEHPTSEFNLVLEGQDTWMARVETVDSASSISSAPSIGIEFVFSDNEL